MPELPDVNAYCAVLSERLIGQSIERLALASPFFLRTYDPPIGAAEQKRIAGVQRMGKRIVLALEGDLFLVFHLMIAGRFRWDGKPTARAPGKIGLAALNFPHGSLLVTEASPKKRAWLRLVDGQEALRALDPGGLELGEISADRFARQLRSESHTLKRALTDPRLFSGIGNAYSDEILAAAGLSPIALTRKLSDEEVHRLFDTAGAILNEWSERLSEAFLERFPGPGEVTAFRPEFAVHGKFGQPCPRCGAEVQRIRYAENETNYCPRCQTGGKILADRSLSRLLKGDWPRSLDEQ